MRIFKVISILPALIFLLAGCGKDEPTTPNVRTFPSELVGTWDLYEYPAAPVSGIFLPVNGGISKSTSLQK